MKNLLICVVIIFYSIATMAKDLGVKGNIFKIKEEGFLAMINRKLNNIDIQKEQQKIHIIAMKKIEEPEPVLGVVKTQRPRSFTFDPTYILQDDITLPNGEILYKAGTHLNPLDYMNFNRKLFFIDGSDKVQINWLKQQLSLCDKDSTKESRIILVKGRPIDTSIEFGQEIYFDQFGELTKKFGIAQVPASVWQEAKFLKIEEVICE